MELDLQVRTDGGFVVLHDDTVERETTGTGLVAGCTGAGIAALGYRMQDCAPLLSKDMVTLLTTAHPHAVVQFNMKNTLGAVGPRGLDHFADHFAGAAAPIIV